MRVAALEQLDKANATFVGAVLNRVDLERNAYYYAQYYRREYSQYYTPSLRLAGDSTGPETAARAR